jgi:hypothetical protein
MDKETRYKAFAQAVSDLGHSTQSLFIIENDEEFEVFERDFQDFLISRGMMTKGDEEPYHLVRMGYDGDMLDDMFRLTVSDEAGHFEPADLDPSMLYSKQSIFQHLYQTITQDKFLVFHITEFPLVYYFEICAAVDVEELSDVMDAQVHDETISRYLDDLRRRGSDEHRKMYSFFYRISTSLLMELSNVFLVVPTTNMHNHLVVTSWRTQTLLLGFSPLTWSSASFDVYDLSGRDIDASWTNLR